METNLKAIGIVLKENMARMYARINEINEKHELDNTVLESAFFKAVKENGVSIENMQAAIDEFKTIIGLYPDTVDAQIAQSFEAAKDKVMEAVKSIDGTPGPQGEPGADGEYSGLDKVQKYIAGNECSARELYAYEGGLWKCTGPTYSSPAVQNERWVLLANGIQGTETKTGVDSAELVIKLADGSRETLKIAIPSPNYTNQVWEKGEDYAARDVVWKDGHSFIALCDTPDGQPGESADWSKYTMRGQAGRRGEKGEAGKIGARGVAGVDGVDGPSDAKIKSFINHILQADESDTPIRNSRGKWVLADQYRVGDVVSMGTGLYLCIQSHEGKAPASDHMAGDYWRVLVPAAGVGVGGSGRGGTNLVSDLGHIHSLIAGSTLADYLLRLHADVNALQVHTSTAPTYPNADDVGSIPVSNDGQFTYVEFNNVVAPVSIGTIDIEDGAEHILHLVQKGATAIPKTSTWVWAYPKAGGTTVRFYSNNQELSEQAIESWLRLGAFITVKYEGGKYIVAKVQLVHTAASDSII